MSLRGAVILFLTSLLACEPGNDAVPGSPESWAVKAFAPEVPRTLARSADSYLIYYGAWDDEKIRVAQTYPLVVLHPSGGNVTRAQVAAIQGGTDPSDPSKRVLVLGYLSIGEDIRTASLDDAQLRADPRFRGNGAGPRIDPRGPSADGQSLDGVDPLGLPSNGGTGWASWYLDDNSVHNSATRVGDGVPDRNRVFNACFVNAGDPLWFDALQGMTLDGIDRAAGIREILTTTVGRGLGCDGLFLDTMDTCAPNSWTDASSLNQSEFEWTAPGFSSFVRRLREAYPDRVILQNRALFFFDPRQRHYRFSARSSLDFVLFESFRLNSGSTSNPDPYFYPDNRYNIAPKLMAESGRPDGFRVLSLGYAEGPSDQMSELTLVGQSTLGYDSLIEDIRVTQERTGFRHFLTNAPVLLVNSFVRDHADLSDAAPPVWTSTYNPNNPGWPNPPGEPPPRVGIQQVIAGSGSLTVRWDVALDLHPVRYALYLQTQPFDFAADPGLSRAARIVLAPEVGQGYADGPGPGVFPYEATVTGLASGTTYYLVIRASDGVNEERNQAVLSATTSGGVASSVLTRWRASNGATNLTYRYQYTGSWNWKRVYIDRDRSIATGFPVGGAGADFLIENGRLFRYVGPGWKWSSVRSVALTSGAIDGMTFVQWTLAQADLGTPVPETHLVFQVERPGAVASSPVYRHVYTPTDPATPILGAYAENDATRIFYHAEFGPTYTWKHVFIDEDQSAATGYPLGSIGAGYLIENGTLYRYTGTRPNWGWTAVGSAHFAVKGSSCDWWLDRSAVGETQAFDASNLIFGGNGGATTSYLSPVYVHRFSR